MRLFSRKRGVRSLAIALSALALWTLSGCDSLLEVELPGNVLEEDLNDPRLANTLVLGAQSDFECGFAAWMMVTTLWTSTMDQSSTLTTHGNLQGRREAASQYGEADCAVDGSPLPFGYWGPLNIARVQAESAVRLIEGFPEGSVSNKAFLIGKAQAYAGYSYQLLSETFCEVYWDAGPRMTQEQGMEIAIQRFTSALQNLSGVTGSDAAEAASLRNMVLVGRARANLHLGNLSEVIADASAVDFEFVRNIDRSGINEFRFNQVFHRSNEDLAYSVGNLQSTYREVEVDGVWTLLVDGVPDPRVRSRDDGIGANQFTPQYSQLKYLSRSDPIPFATWKEAQLMIAEVEGGGTAVDIINMLRDYHGLPHFASADPGAIRAQVLEERRRELWLQGVRMGDMLRLGIPFPTGVTPAGQVIVDTTPWCFPTQEEEILGNPNAS